MAVSDLLGQLIGNSTPGPNSAPVDVNQVLGSQPNGQPLPSLQQAPVAPTDPSIDRPFTHYEVAKKHGLHELLSIAGDMALASAGLQPQYLPSLQAAKEADALADFQTDPAAAVNRLTAVNPQAGQKLYNDLVTDTYHRALTNSSVASAQAAAQKSVQDTDLYKQKVLGAATSMAAAAIKDPKSWPVVRDRIKQFAAARGASDLISNLPDAYDVDAIQSFANSSVPVDKQVDNARQQEALDNTEDYQDKSLALRNEEVGISGANSANQSRNIDSEISDRLWRQKHGDNIDTRADANSASQIAHRKWLEDHPSKQRQSSAPAVGYKNSNGLTFRGGDPNVRANWK
jgi:hypothetical protein